MSVSSYIPTATEKHRTFLTVCMYACFLALGLVGSVMGPTLVHMQHLLDTDLQSLTLTFTYQRIGYLIGVAISGLLFDRLNQEIQFAIVCLIEGVATALAPWMPNLYGYYAVMSVQSLAHGYINTGTQSFMIGLWENHKYKRPVIQGGTVMWSLGASICPFIVSPFLVALPSSTSQPNSGIFNSTNDSYLVLNSSTEVDPSVVESLTDIGNVRYAYFIIGMCIAVISILFFIAFFLQGASCENDGVTITQTKVPLHGDTYGFKIPMLVMLFLFFVFYIWYEGVPGGLLSAFVIQGLQWPVHQGPLITSVYYGAHGLGRVLGIPVSMCLSSGAMLICNLTLTLAAFIVMYLAPMADNDVFMWLAAAMAGFAMSTTFACMLLWVSNHMTITGAAGSVFLMGTSVGGMTGAALAGHLFQTHTHMWVVYLSLAACSAHVLLFTLMFLFAQWHKRRSRRTHTKLTKVTKKRNHPNRNHHKVVLNGNVAHVMINNNKTLNRVKEMDSSGCSTPVSMTSDIEKSTESICSNLVTCCVHNSTTCNCLNFQLRQASNLM